MKFTVSITEDNKLEINVPDAGKTNPVGEHTVSLPKKRSRRTKGRSNYKVNESTALKLIDGGVFQYLHGVHDVNGERMYYFDKVDEVKAALDLIQPREPLEAQEQIDVARVPVCNLNE